VDNAETLYIVSRWLNRNDFSSRRKERNNGVVADGTVSWWKLHLAYHYIQNGAYPTAHIVKPKIVMQINNTPTTFGHQNTEIYMHDYWLV